ncbi:hypothetical protein CDL15_Pgr001154 [Punica granatum]|uniref:PDZ domain-containing protein n=1 Tax=Punica granatum TaxID=22663 RepID=A0A218WKY8_PUNGR|nr:hypothetical protein CDL15_Pgr001154 [Punica granatum]
MRLFLCNSSAALRPPPPPGPAAFPTPATATPLLFNNFTSAKTKLIGAALSLGLLLSSPPSLSLDLDSSINQLKPYGGPSVEDCREDEREDKEEVAPQAVSNESIVEEAWEIVNDSFLDSGRHRWSPQTWQAMLSSLLRCLDFYIARFESAILVGQKKEDIMGTNIQTRSKAHEIIRRMLASLGDPYTRFLSPDEFSKMARYDMSGIGINLREVPGDDGNVKLKVLGLLLDGPAYAAGVRQGDEILAVNGDEVKGKSAFEVSSLLQGPNGTSVIIQVKHGNCGSIQSLEVQRQLVARTPVFYRMEQVENGSMSIGYMRLKEFNALARKDLVTAMRRLQDMGATYFILDLRDNLGGLVQAGIEISKLFLNHGATVTYTVGRDAQYQTTIKADTAPLVTAPVVVASALHDNCRAVLVGDKTYGKGLIQSVFELHDGSGVVVTVGKYVTPNHMDINGNGIEPDFHSLPGFNRDKIIHEHLNLRLFPVLFSPLVALCKFLLIRKFLYLYALIVFLGV